MYNWLAARPRKELNFIIYKIIVLFKVILWHGWSDKYLIEGVKERHCEIWEVDNNKKIMNIRRNLAYTYYIIKYWWRTIGRISSDKLITTKGRKLIEYAKSQTSKSICLQTSVTLYRRTSYTGKLTHYVLTKTKSKQNNKITKMKKNEMYK